MSIINKILKCDITGIEDIGNQIISILQSSETSSKYSVDISNAQLRYSDENSIVIDCFISCTPMGDVSGVVKDICVITILLSEEEIVVDTQLSTNEDDFVEEHIHQMVLDILNQQS